MKNITQWLGIIKGRCNKEQDLIRLQVSSDIKIQLLQLLPNLCLSSIVKAQVEN